MKRTYTRFIIFILFLLSLSIRAVAENDPTLYRAELPIISVESAPTNDELKMALAQVLSKLTNVQDIATNSAWADSLNHAQDWMLSYQYIPASNGNPLTLQVDFDSTAISQLLKTKNAPTTASSPAVSQPSTAVSKVEVVVYGIGDVSALDGLKSSLQRLTPVQDIEVVEVSPDEVILNINAQGGRTALDQAINDQILTLSKTQSTDQNISNDALIYQWVS